MPLKDLLVSFSNGSSSDAVLEFGLALARQTGATASAIHVTPPIFEQNQIATWMPDALMDQIRQAKQDAPQLAQKALQDRLATQAPQQDVRWISAAGDIVDTLAMAARTHDLLLLGRYRETNEEDGTHVRPEQIVTRSGRPLIIVPRSWRGDRLGRAVIAWDGGHTAARALFDMMHLLPCIDELHVVSVTSGSSALLGDVEAHLARHGRQARIKTLKPGNNTAAQILSYCDDIDADLLVAGSRGTTRLRAGFVPGGTGRGFFDQARCPVFVSH
ncbi:MAG: universal stress protein [Qingshengfaniella sp.]